MKNYLIILIIFTALLNGCISQWGSYCGDDICSIGEVCAQDCTEEGGAALSWQDNSRTEEGFEVERQMEDSDFTLLQRVGPDETHYLDATLEKGRHYSYRVRGYRDASSTYSDYSNVATIQTEDRTPGGQGSIREIRIRVDIAKQNPSVENINVVIELTKQRQTRILNELKTNPAALHEELLPASIRQDMPVEALEYVEKPLSIDGKIEVTSFDDFEKKTSWEEYTLVVENPGADTKYELYAAQNQELAPGTGEVQGYVLGNAVVAESVEYERTPVVTGAVGEQRTIYILIRRTGGANNMPTKEQIKERIDNGPFAGFIAEASYGRAWFKNDVTDWISIDTPIYTFHEDVALQLQHQGTINLNNYDRIVYIVWEAGGGFSCVTTCGIEDGEDYYNVSQSLVGLWDADSSFSLISTSNKKFSSFDFVLSHELGHALGVIHANSFTCTGDDPETQDCNHQEYGNMFDTMGSGSYALHYNGAMKEALGWLDESSVQYVTTTGTYTIKPLEQSTGIRSLRLPVIGTNGVNIEYRQPTGYDIGLEDSEVALNARGASVNQLQEGDLLATELLDLYKEDGQVYSRIWALQQGQSYTDLSSGFIIGPVINATPAGLTLNITRMPPQCVPKLPSMAYSNMYLIAERGETDLYAYTTIQSRENLLCGDKQITVSLDETSDGERIIDAGPAVQTVLAPNAMVFASIPFNVSASAPYGFRIMNMTLHTNTKTYTKNIYLLDIVQPLAYTKVRSVNSIAPGTQDVELAVFDIKSNGRYPADYDSKYDSSYAVNVVELHWVEWMGKQPFTSLKLRIEADGKTIERELITERGPTNLELDEYLIMQRGAIARVTLIADVNETADENDRVALEARLCEGYHCFPVSGESSTGSITFTTEQTLPAPTNLVVELAES
jgi:hypothetical protein